MLEYSKEILFIVLAVCALGLTAFLCIVLFHLIKILKNASLMVDEIKEKVEYLAGVIDSIRAKVESLSMLASGGLGGMVKKMVGRKAEKLAEETTDKITEAARSAVDKAVEATADKMKKMTRKIKK